MTQTLADFKSQLHAKTEIAVTLTFYSHCLMDQQYANQ